MKTFPIILMLILLLVALAACNKKKKEQPKQYSTWIVNGTDTFTTNNVDSSVDCNPDKSYCIAGLRSKDDIENRFELAFALDYFPYGNNYPIIYNTQPIGYITCAIKLYYNNKYYYQSPLTTTDSVYSSINKDNIKYRLRACRFVRYQYPEDTIRVEGTFSFP